MKEGTIYCKDCKALLYLNGKFVRGNEGEQEIGIFGKRWVYRCIPCRDKNFCNMVNSDPRLKHKYYSIYGTSPEEQLNN